MRTIEVDMSIKTRSKGLLSIFFTAGYPKLDSTLTILRTLDKADVDFIELGIPYSDPLADGPVIQESAKKALENGMTLDHLFEQLRNYSGKTPVLLMGYTNSVLQYGVERFCEHCAECGVPGVILPDLPPDYYEAHFQTTFEQHGLGIVFLVTPRTSAERVVYLDNLSSPFLYAVSAASTTGTKQLGSVELYTDRLKSLELRNPVLVGFNVATGEDFQQVNQFAEGAIIGSAFIKALESDEGLEASINHFISKIRQHDNSAGSNN